MRNGHIKRITDNDIQSLVLEIEGTNVSTTYITCPQDPKKTLGIKLPFLVMIIKNLKKYFSFEVQVSPGTIGASLKPINFPLYEKAATIRHIKEVSVISDWLFIPSTRMLLDEPQK